MGEILEISNTFYSNLEIFREIEREGDLRVFFQVPECGSKFLSFALPTGALLAVHHVYVHKKSAK